VNRSSSLLQLPRASKPAGLPKPDIPDQPSAATRAVQSRGRSASAPISYFSDYFRNRHVASIRGDRRPLIPNPESDPQIRKPGLREEAGLVDRRIGI